MTQYVTEAVPTELCMTVWKHVKHFLQPAVDMSEGRWDMDHVLVAIATGHYLLWVVTDTQKNEPVMALTTQIVAYPERRIMAIHFLGGSDLENCYPNFIEALTAHALREGCDGLECSARAGFWKTLKYDEWNRSAVLFTRYL